MFDTHSVIMVGDPGQELASALEASGFGCVLARDAASLRRALGAERPPWMLLVHWDSVPTLASFACAIAGQLGEAKPYVLVLTADDSTWHRALFDGADDLLQLPATPTALRLRISVGQRTQALRCHAGSVRSHLLHRATHDQLTGVWNKSAITGLLYRESVRAVRDRVALAALMCDVDHFKAINDRFGHLAGDEVLRGIAARLKSVLRPYDSVGRYGGEEFLVLLPSCTGEEARDIAERLVVRVRELAFEVHGHTVHATVSIGAALLDGIAEDPAAQRCPDGVLQLADSALYSAKNRGRDRAEVTWTE